MSEVTDKLGSIEYMDRYQTALSQQADYLSKLAVLMPTSDWGNSVRLLAMATGDSCKALVLLGDNNHLNEMLMVSRAILERLVNLCYLAVCGPEEVNRFRLYAIHKGYRKLDREFAGFGVKYTGEVDVSQSPDLQQALSLFTSKDGKELTTWTTRGLRERVKLIGERTSFPVGLFAILYLTVYEDASEALHGTLYGAGAEHAPFQPKKKEPWDLQTRRLKSHLYMLTSKIIAGSITVVSSYLGSQDALRLAVASRFDWDWPDLKREQDKKLDEFIASGSEPPQE